MAFRDYNDDGKIDFMDDMIEDEIFYEDDDELNARFRSIHNTLNSKPRSYSMGRFAADSEKAVHKSTLNSSIENFENYLTASKKPSFEEIIYFRSYRNVISQFACADKAAAIAGIFSVSH